MHYAILLSRSENTKEVEAQEQARFIKSIFEALELPVEFDPEMPMSPEDRQKLRQDLKNFGLQIIDDLDGGIKVFLGENSDCIAEWHKATYKLKQDLSQASLFDRLYLEMNISFWSIFEEDEEKESEM
jgi:hypothetical protein